MSSLNELALMRSKNGDSDPTAPKPPTQPPPTKGDDALNLAWETVNVTNEETRLAKTFMQSHQIIDAKMQTNEAYRNSIAPELEKASGDFGAYMDLVNKEARKEKIAMLRQEKPEWFNSAEAAKVGFFNEATFGQLSKVIGGLEALHPSGRPYAEVVAEKAEQFQLLSEAFPGWTTAAQAAAYLVPGSPAKMLFSKLAGLGERIGAKAAATGLASSAQAALLKKVAANPKLIENMLKGGASGALTSGAIAGIQGALGTDLQDADLDRGVNAGLMGMVIGGTLSGGFPLAGEVLSQGAKAAKPYVNRMAKGFDSQVGRAVGEITGTSEKALERYNANPQGLRNIVAKGAENLGDEILDAADNSLNSPFIKAAKSVLPFMDDVDAKPLIDKMTSLKTPNNPGLDAAVTRIKEWGERLRTKIGPDGKVPASEMAVWKKEFQEAAEYTEQQLGSVSAQKLHQRIIHDIGRDARKIVEGSAKALEKHPDPLMRQRGAAYIENMRQGAREVRVANSVLKMLGNSKEAREKTAEKFVDNLFGKNKEWQRKRLAQLDVIVGATPENGFIAQADNYWAAKQLGGKSGPSATPSWANTSPTGKSVYGMMMGGAVGAANQVMTSGDGEALNYQTGAALGALATSPKVGAYVLGSSGAISGFVRKMFANPRAIDTVAGRLMAKGADVQALKVIRAPIEIRRIAQAIQTTLQKEGPKSAASLTRVIADTPYFVGLVHYFDLAEQVQKRTEAPGVAKRLQQSDPYIATPR